MAGSNVQSGFDSCYSIWFTAECGDKKSFSTASLEVIMRYRSQFIYMLVAIATVPPLALAEQEWDSQANIRQAVEDFKRLQDSEGNQEVIRKTSSCYLAVRITGPSKQLEYCIAFDAANIEMTSFVYKGLAEKYKSSTAAQLQPPETTRPIGQKRIFTQAAHANIQNPIDYSTAIYNKATQSLVDLLAPQQK